MTEVIARRRISTLAYLSLILRLLVGGTLVFSGVTKLPVHSDFVEIVNSYQILPEILGTVYALILPWAEFVLGAYLFLGILVRPSAFVSVLMAISFTVANVISILGGEKYCSSCFGEAVILPTPFSLAIDVLIILAGVYLVIKGNKEPLLTFDNRFTRRQRRRVIGGDKPGGV